MDLALKVELIKASNGCGKLPAPIGSASLVDELREHHVRELLRAGDRVRVLVGHDRGAIWRVAVYDQSSDVAWVLGHPCVMIVHASKAVEIYDRCDDAMHEDVRHQVGTMHRDDARRRAHDRQLLGLPA